VAEIKEITYLVKELCNDLILYNVQNRLYTILATSQIKPKTLKVTFKELFCLYEHEGKKMYGDHVIASEKGLRNLLNKNDMYFRYYGIRLEVIEKNHV
jgi:hypothetical protein